MDQHQFVLKNLPFIRLTFEGTIKYASEVALKIALQTDQPAVQRQARKLLQKIVEPYARVFPLMEELERDAERAEDLNPTLHFNPSFGPQSTIEYQPHDLQTETQQPQYFGASQATQGFATLAEMRAIEEVEEDLASGLKVWSKELNMAVDLCDLQRIGHWDRRMTY
jgi:hypothetical protein